MSPGRPPLPPEQRRTEYIGIRVSKPELVRLYAVARLVRMDVSEFVRRLALNDFPPGSEFNAHTKY